MKNFRKILGLLTLTIILLTSCDPDDPGTSDPCDDALVFGLKTSDPYSWTTDLFTAASDEDMSWTIPPFSLVASGFSPVELPAANVSTYNFDNESYHYYDRGSNQFVNINEDGTFNIVSLIGGINGWTYSGLVYVSGTGNYMFVGVGPLGEVGVIKIIDINTGEVADTPHIIVSGFTFASYLDGQKFIRNVSSATNNDLEIYIVSERNYFKFDLGAATGTQYDLPGTIEDNYYGLEYNNNDGLLYALFMEGFDTSTKLVNMATPTGSITSSTVNIIDIMPQIAYSRVAYSSTLTCSEGKYILAYRYANATTKFLTIDISGGLPPVAPSGIDIDTKPEYYFGIESNGNN